MFSDKSDNVLIGFIVVIIFFILYFMGTTYDDTDKLNKTKTSYRYIVKVPGVVMFTNDNSVHDSCVKTQSGKVCGSFVILSNPDFEGK